MTAPDLLDEEAPAGRAAELLAAAWWPSHRAMYQLGHRDGYRTGWHAGYDQCAAQTTAAFGVYRDAIEHPMRAEIDAADREPIRVCSAGCGVCSACIRAAAVVRNRATYGSEDYPGRSAIWTAT